MDKREAEILRRKTPAERLALANDLCRAVRDMMLQSVRSAHPDWTNDEVKREVARRIARG